MAALNDGSYRSDGGAIGRGAPSTETRPADLGARGFLRCAILAGRGETTGWVIGGEAGAVATAFRKASTFATKSVTWSDSVFRSAFWASRFSDADRKESVVCRSKGIKI
jgi:hypothetical protein